MRAVVLTLSNRAAAVKAALLDPVALLPALGLDGLRREGRGWKARCVWHVERTASMSLLGHDDGLGVRCFGCGRSGTVLDLIAAVHGLQIPGRDFGRLVEIGEQIAGIVPGGASRPQRPAPQDAPASRPDDTAERYAVQARIHRVLLDVAPIGDEGVAYMVKRGFLKDEIPLEDWCLLPPPGEQRRVLEAIIGEIGREAWRARSGLATRYGHGFAHPAARLVIPWRSGLGTQADVALLQRRRLDDGKPKYVGPADLVALWPFGIEDAEIASDETTLVIVEGALDVLAVRALARRDNLDWWPLGIPGTGAWRSEWAELGAGRSVIVALDADRGGNEKLETIMLDFEDAGVRVTSRQPVHGKDWCDTIAQLRGGKVAA